MFAQLLRCRGEYLAVHGLKESTLVVGEQAAQVSTSLRVVSKRDTESNDASDLHVDAELGELVFDRRPESFPRRAGRKPALSQIMHQLLCGEVNDVRGGDIASELFDELARLKADEAVLLAQTFHGAPKLR